MALLRFCVVFLLGLGVALGAYATGALDYVSRQHYFRSWYAPESVVANRDMVLRVSGTALNGYCTERYTIDNRSSRRVFVVVSPDAGPGRFSLYARGPSYGYEGPGEDRYNNDVHEHYADAGEEYRPAEDGYPRSDIDAGYRQPIPPASGGAPYADAPPYQAAGEQAPPPVEVGPGETKIIGRMNDAQSADADVGGAYGPVDDAAMAPDRCGDRVVRLQLIDCSRGDGTCAVAPNYPGWANHQGDE